MTGKDYTGGIAGKVYVAAMPIGCYNVGTVSPAVYCGGAVGSFGGDDYITGKTGSFYQGPLSSAFKANGATERTEGGDEEGLLCGRAEPGRLSELLYEGQQKYQ